MGDKLQVGVINILIKVDIIKVDIIKVDIIMVDIIMVDIIKEDIIKEGIIKELGDKLGGKLVDKQEDKLVVAINILHQGQQ